jgi:hypothetical protein
VETMGKMHRSQTIIDPEQHQTLGEIAGIKAQASPRSFALQYTTGWQNATMTRS